MQPGQTNVKVPVKIANNTGILGMTWSVYYDDSRLKLKDIKNGKAFKDILTLTKAGKLKKRLRKTFSYAILCIVRERHTQNLSIARV